MKIGMTYDLREDYLKRGFSEEETAEFDSPVTINGIEKALKNLGHTIDRIGSLPDLVSRLARGDRWDLVFNIAEGLYGFGRESQIPALLEGYRIPCTFSDSMILAITLHKGITKNLLRDLGLPTPAFLVAESIEDLHAPLKKLGLQFPLFIKPVAEGTSKGITGASLVKDKKSLEATCLHLLKTFNQPVLVENFLPGREFTVGIIGTTASAQSLGVMEVQLNERAEQDVYSYENKEEYEDRVSYHLVKDKVAKKAEEIALKAWKKLGCRDGGRVDLRLDEAGIPNIMEINPLPGLNPLRSDLPILCSLIGITYPQLIERIFQSALKRVVIS